MKVYLKQCSLPIPRNIHPEEYDLSKTTSTDSYFSIITSAYLDTLHYCNTPVTGIPRCHKLRLLRSKSGLEWFVSDLLRCFDNPEYKNALQFKLRSLPKSLKFMRHIDFGAGIESRHKTVAHEVMWDCVAAASTSEQLLEFYDWFTLHPQYSSASNIRASNQHVIDYFWVSRPIKKGVAA